MSRSSIGKQVRIGDFPLSNELTVTLSGPERDHYTLSVAAYISTEHATLCLLPHAAALRPQRGLTGRASSSPHLHRTALRLLFR